LHGDSRAGRERLLRDLAAYAPGDAYEAALAERIAAFVRAHDTCFERTLAIGHVTGSAWIVDRSGTAALLAHHRKLRAWLQLGGHATATRTSAPCRSRSPAPSRTRSHGYLAQIERYTIDDSVRRLVAKTPALIAASP